MSEADTTAQGPTYQTTADNASGHEAELQFYFFQGAIYTPANSLGVLSVARRCRAIEQRIFVSIGT